MPIDVQGPDGQKYQFPDGTDPAVMKQAMAKRYPKPQVNERDIPFADMAPKKPVDIMGTNIDTLGAKGDGVVDIVGDRFKRQREVGDDFSRRQLSTKANQAGVNARAQAGESLGSNPLVAAMAGPGLEQFGTQAARDVYRGADVMMPDSAAAIRAANSAGLGIPATVSKDVRQGVAKAGEDQPGASLAGDVAGSILPGEMAFRGTKAAYNATLKPLITRALPSGGSKLAQATRFGVHGAEQAATWAGQNALYRSTTGASVDAAAEGRAATWDERMEGARAGATDPVNIAGPAAGIGLSRTMRFLKTGGRTSVPQDRSDFVAGLGGRAPGSGTILNAEQFGDIDPLAEKQLVRLLEGAGYKSDDIAAALGAFENASQGVVDDALLPMRLKDVFVEHLGDNAAGPIDGFLKGAGNSTGAPSETIVRQGVDADRRAFSQFVNDSAQNRFGAGSRFDNLNAANEELATIGGKYEELFQPGAVVASPEDMTALQRVVDFYAGDPKVMQYVRAQASASQMTPEEYIAQDPRRAAHLMQQVAREIVDAERASASPSGTVINAYSRVRSNLLDPLEAATPGYRQVREEFGDEYGMKQALTFAGRFFTKAEDDIAVGLLADEFAAMTPAQQDAAKLAVRDEALKFANRRTEGGSPRLTKIGNEPSLAAIERVFGQDGAEFANDIRVLVKPETGRIPRNEFISTVGPNTMNKQQGREAAERAVSNPLTRRIGGMLENMGGDAAIMGATGFFSPVMTGRAVLRGAGNALARGRQGKIDNLTDLLMRDAGARPRAPMSGDGPVPTSGAAPSGAISEGVQTPAPNALAQTSAPAGPVRGAGWTGTRPRGFNDDLERGTDAFSDPRLNADQNKIAEMAKNGYSNAEIGEEMGKLPQTVAVRISQLRRKGIDIPAGRAIRPVTPERVQMEKLINEGLSNAQIAKRTGKSSAHVGVIRNRLKTTGPAHAGFEGAKGDLASGAVGSSYGYTQGDTPEEKNANAAMGFVSGIAAKRAGGAVVRRGSAMTNALAPKGPVRGAGLIGNTPKRGAKRLGRGLDDLTNEPGPAKPALPDDLPRRTVEPPAQGRPDPTLSRERTSKDDKAFYDSLSAPERDHARAVGPIGKMGKEPPPPGFVVTASLLTALGGAGGVSAYLGSRPVEPNFAQNRSKVMSELAKAPDSATWQNRARQFDAFVKSDTARQTDLEGVDKRLLNARRKAVREASDAFATAGDRAELTAAIDRVEALDYAIDVSLGNAEPFDEAPPMARPPSLKPVPNALAGPPPMTRNSQGQFVRPMTNRERQEAAR